MRRNDLVLRSDRVGQPLIEDLSPRGETKPIVEPSDSSDWSDDDITGRSLPKMSSVSNSGSTGVLPLSLLTGLSAGGRLCRVLPESLHGTPFRGACVEERISSRVLPDALHVTPPPRIGKCQTLPEALYNDGRSLPMSFLEGNISEVMGMYPVQRLKATIPERVVAPSGSPSVFKVLDLIGGLPAKAMPNERNRSWGDEPVTASTLLNAEELLLLGAPNAGAHLSLFRAFTKWRGRYTAHISLPETLIIFASYLDSTGLKKTTCAEYVRMAKKMALRSGEQFGDPSGAVERVLKGLDLKAAQEKPEHAIDITVERLHEILATVRREDVRWTIWLMANCGARAADLRRLESVQLRIEGNRLTILFRVTKTIRAPGGATEITYEVTGFEEQWREFLLQPTPCTVNADAINKTLDAAGCEETSYSFRRFFIHNTIDRFTEDGHTDWCRVIEMTNHEKVSTVKSSYQTHIDDDAPDTQVSAGKKSKRTREVPIPSELLAPTGKKTGLKQPTLLKMFAAKKHNEQSPL